MKLWYKVEAVVWSTVDTPGHHVAISRPLTEEGARRDAQEASLRYEQGVGIFQMPAGHLICEYKGGIEVSIHDCETPVTSGKGGQQ